jgi:hypothetical protein
VQQLWCTPEADPARKASESALQRNWAVEAGMDISGKSGNSEQFTSALHVRAKLEGPDDELELYARSERSSKEGDQTADEQLGGFRYTAWVYDTLGWYVRSELEQDEFEDIQLRSTSAAGLRWRPVDAENLKLRFSSGLSYRYEDYISNAESDEQLGLDFGLSHLWRRPDRFEMKNDFQFVPSMEDFSDYLITQDSSLTLPLAQGPWKLRAGVRNEYNAQPEGGRKNLDTTWYSSMILQLK